MLNEVSIVIDRPAEVIFPYLTETDKLKQWMSTFLGSNRPADGKLGAGMTFVDTYGQSGGSSNVETEVTAFEPNRRIQLSMVNPFSAATVDFILSPTGGGTEVAYKVNTESRGLILSILMKVSGIFMNPAARRQYQNDLKKLKKLVEQA